MKQEEDRVRFTAPWQVLAGSFGSMKPDIGGLLLFHFFHLFPIFHFCKKIGYGIYDGTLSKRAARLDSWVLFQEDLPCGSEPQRFDPRLVDLLSQKGAASPILEDIRPWRFPSFAEHTRMDWINLFLGSGRVRCRESAAQRDQRKLFEVLSLILCQCVSIQSLWLTTCFFCFQALWRQYVFFLFSQKFSDVCRCSLLEWFQGT